MKRLDNGIKLNDTGKELIIGDLVFFVLGEIIILIFTGRKLYCSIGFIIGLLISVFMIVNMTIAMEQAMSMGEKDADFHVRKTTAIRMLTVFALLVLAGLSDIGNIVATVAGVMALKVSAYLQPFTHKVLTIIDNRKARKGR